MNEKRGESSRAEKQLNKSLLECKKSIHTIVGYGEYIDGTKVEITEYEQQLGDIKVGVYDAMSYWSGDGGPAYGITVQYHDVEGFRCDEWLGFVGYDEEPVISLESENPVIESIPRHRPAAKDEIEMFSQLLHFVESNLGEAPVRSAGTWRGDAPHLQPNLKLLK